MADPLTDHLSQIVTRWSVLRDARDPRASQGRAAHEQILERYGGAVRRYLLACVRQPDAADEIYQEFALRLIQGGFSGACPEKGRFRNYLKGVLFHLLANHRQKLKRQPLEWNSQLPEPSDSGTEDFGGQTQFNDDWRSELLAQVWSEMERESIHSGQHFFEVLSYRRDHADQRSDEMATVFSKRWGKPVTAAAIRQSLHRARERFAELLLDRVMHSLAEPCVESLREELAELKLLQYCQPALDGIGKPEYPHHGK